MAEEIISGLGIEQLKRLYEELTKVLDTAEKSRKEYEKEIEVVKRASAQVRRIRSEIEEFVSKKQEEIEKVLGSREFKEASERLKTLPESVLRMLLGEDAGIIIGKPVRVSGSVRSSRSGVAGEVLRILEENRGRKVSGQELAEKLGLPVSELGKRVYHLVRSGKIRKEKVNGRLVYWVE